MILTNNQIQEVLALSNEMLKNDTDNHLRFGQAFFNALETLYPDAANHIRTTEYDCFYQDEKINHTIKYLTQ